MQVVTIVISNIFDYMMILAAYGYMIIENLSEITAGSTMVGSAIILVRRPINPGLIKDLWIMPLRPKTSEMAKEQETKVEPSGIKPRATATPCHCCH